MPKALERKFEKFYEKKGYTKKEADVIFYKTQNKLKAQAHKLKGGR